MTNLCFRIACFVTLSLIVHAENARPQNDLLKEEFNIAQYWHDGMTWEEFLAIRNDLRRDGLIKYVDKIEQQKMAHEHGLRVPKTFLASREKVPLIETLSALSTYVVKMTHLSCSQGLILVRNGKNMITGEPITPAQVLKRVLKFLEKKPRDVESWALHQVPPGFMVQEYIPNRMEVKIQTVWGKTVIGEWRGGEPKKAMTPVFGKYDRNGTRVEGAHTAPAWWPDAVAAAEHMAKGTDALRVDFLVTQDGQLLLSEMEIWPESNWSSMKEALEEQLNDGYRKICKIDQ